jgi:hypothetical protein
MGKYTSFAKNAAQERDGVPLRDAFIELLVLLWQDNDPDQVDALWLMMAQRPNSFTADALDVLAAIADNPPDDLLDLLRTHGWISLYHQNADGSQTRYTIEEAVDWLRSTYDRFKAVHEAEHPEPESHHTREQ